MKKIILPLLLACCATLNAEDCAKNTDACSAGKKTIVSPFLAASAQPAKAAAAVPAKKAAGPVRPAVSSAPAVEASSATAPAPAASPVPASSPLWLLLVGVGLAALYFYLGGKNGKRKRK